MSCTLTSSSSFRTVALCIVSSISARAASSQESTPALLGTTQRFVIQVDSSLRITFHDLSEVTRFKRCIPIRAHHKTPQHDQFSSHHEALGQGNTNLRKLRAKRPIAVPCG
ncbi:hypothetical protein BGW80DRAFT_870411 [Lactifluus volemus]|nr:hypothetical protein BGW80DRAFT_870411 [Lactifluus volemus]